MTRTDAFFTSRELWEILDRSDNVGFRRSIWNVLLQRDLKTEVIKKLEDESPPERRHLLERMLPQPYSNPNGTLSEGEKAMWLAEFESDPISIGYYLKCYLDRMPAQKSAFEGLTPRAREFWLEETKKSSASKANFQIRGKFHEWVGALNFSQSIDPKFDTDILQQLAQHRGYTVQKSSRSSGGDRFDIVEHRYHIRATAKKLLQDQGDKISADLPDSVVISKIARKKESPRKKPEPPVEKSAAGNGPFDF